MIEYLIEPFTYGYMWRAIWVATVVAVLCGALSCFLMLKGWSLMGDALSHAVVPGVALAYLLQLPYGVGAFVSGVLAAISMLIVKSATQLREDAVMGVVFTAFFAAGLLIVAINPTAVDVQRIVLGNILGISPADALQAAIIAGCAMLLLALFWRQWMQIFFDEVHAQSQGVNTLILKVMFFVVLSASIVAALQAVGAVLVIALVITPGATAYLLTDRFGVMLWLAMAIAGATAALGAYVSYFLDGATGGLIVVLQTLVFLAAFLFAPKHGVIAARRSVAQGRGT